MIKENKKKILIENNEASIETIKQFLDSSYYLIEHFLDEDGSFKKGLKEDLKLKNYLNTLKTEAKEYEIIRHKLINKKFDELSEVDIRKIVLAFTLTVTKLESKIEDCQKAITMTNKIIRELNEN